MVLESVQTAPFNVLHLHGYKDIYFDMVNDLPAKIVCWSDQAGNGPSLKEARTLYGGCLMGGIDETSFGDLNPEQIKLQGLVAIKEAGRDKLILSPGCAVSSNVSADRLLALRQAAIES